MPDRIWLRLTEADVSKTVVDGWQFCRHHAMVSAQMQADHERLVGTPPEKFTTADNAGNQIDVEWIDCRVVDITRAHPGNRPDEDDLKFGFFRRPLSLLISRWEVITLGHLNDEPGLVIGKDWEFFDYVDTKMARAKFVADKRGYFPPVEKNAAGVGGVWVNIEDKSAGADGRPPPRDLVADHLFRRPIYASEKLRNPKKDDEGDRLSKFFFAPKSNPALDRAQKAFDMGYMAELVVPLRDWFDAVDENGVVSKQRLNIETGTYFTRFSLRNGMVRLSLSLAMKRLPKITEEGEWGQSVELGTGTIDVLPQTLGFFTVAQSDEKVVELNYLSGHKEFVWKK